MKEIISTQYSAHSSVCLYPWKIVYHRPPDEELRRHEWAHVYQIKRDGKLKFYSRYIWEKFIKKIPWDQREYEQEAVRLAKDPEFNLWVAHYADKPDLDFISRLWREVPRTKTYRG